MLELYELRRKLAEQNKTNDELNRRLLAAEAELKTAQEHRQAVSESQRQADLESKAIAELQGRCKAGLERQLLTILKGEDLLIEDGNRLVFKTEGEWNPSVPIPERIDDLLENRYPHFQNQKPKQDPGSDRTPQSYENLRSPRDILKACQDLDGIQREHQEQRYQSQKDAARAVSEEFKQGVPTRAKTLSLQELRRRLFEEQKRLS